MAIFQDVLLAFVLYIFLIRTVRCIVCYDYDGSPFTTNVPCDGSNVCCGDAKQCTPNRLCAKNNTLVRAPCNNMAWNDCSPLCLYSTGTGFLPRVVQCSDSSYCCDNEPGCCLNHTGVVLNGNGVVVTTLPGLTSTSSSSSTSATSTSTTSSLPISAVNSTSFSSATSSTSSAPVAPTASATSSTLPKPIPYQGIVGGVVGAVAVIASIAGFLIWRQRRRVIRLEAAVAAAQLPEEYKMQSYADTQGGAYAKAPVQTIRAEIDTGIPEPTEIDGIGVHNRLVELPVSHDRK